MSNINLNSLIFIFQIIIIYFLSRGSINEIYYFLQKIIKNEKVVFSLLSLIFLPGTIIHELAHFFTAIILFLPVNEITIMPSFEKEQIRLGSVIYAKKDVLRSILVGIAPFVVALLLFWLITLWKIFPQESLILNILLIYLIFTVSSTMFSSKSDVQDLIFIIPLAIIILGIIYVLNLKLDAIFKNQLLINNIGSFLASVNNYLFLSVVINIILILFFKGLRFILRND